MKKYFLILFFSVISIFCFLDISWAEDEKEKLEAPIMVNGDTVEYSNDNKEISASGNVTVVYKGTKLSCDKLSVNTQTKDAKAEGHIKIEDEKGSIEGKEILYNFDKKTGKVTDAQFSYPPYFGKAKVIERLSESEFIVLDGYATTCSLASPHYRIVSKRINFFPQDKIQTKNNLLCIGKAPVLYLPVFNHSLEEKIYHFQVLPGKSGNWGPYLLSLLRFDLTQNTKARLYLDYRDKLGMAEGLGVNYATAGYGKGDFKFYYTHEVPKNLEKDSPHEFERYLVRSRHNWEVDSRTRALLEYYKIQDSKIQLGSDQNFLKDYFYREYEKDAQPKSYLLLTHAFNYSSAALLAQKRTNRWFAHADKVPDEKLPEATFNLPEYQLAETPLYFKNITSVANLANRYPAPSDQHESVVRADTYNQLSLPFRASVFNFNPFAGSRETYYSRDINGNSLNPRTIFYSGVDLSTKFYRLFNVNSNFLGMDIHGLRHIITPMVRYAYNNNPTIPTTKLQIFDDIEDISSSNKLTLELLNKLQTKRHTDGNTEATADFAALKVSTDYSIKPKGGSGSSFSDFLFDLELMPYSWLRIDNDVIYDHRQDVFKQIDTDWYANLGKDRTFGIGNRYQRKGGKEVTAELNWRLTPKWKYKIYERYQLARIFGKGFKEQEYTLSRDLHCWEIDLTYNINKDKGHTIWVVLRLKAFPETELKFDQSYHTSKAGSQSQTLQP